MSDTVTVDNATNGDYVVSTDDAGASGQVQRVKLTYSADGDATHIAADADGLLVNLGSNNDVSVSGTASVKEARGATATLTTVADNSASTSILASNANRLRATITNDSSARLYLRFEAAAASTANYGVSLAQHETWVEDQYTGEIRGIWASDPGDGAARVTEVTT